ncbi:MAG: GHMP kinase [Firmicutes bacterium]|nr:GHMP kinase [Bacillota bacterium]
MNLQGIVRMPGSCGELVQGTASGVNFHVTCPVNLYSKATVTLVPSLKKIFYPKNRTKTAQAVRKILNHFGYFDFGAIIEIASSLPLGKGMASSTADLAAACYAVGAALKIRVEPGVIAKIALSIEPSDGTFYPGIWLFDHVRGSMQESLGEPLPLGILVLDFGGAVDTLKFNQHPELPLYNQMNEAKTKAALELVKLGLSRKDPFLVGEGATISAMANQAINPKPRFHELVDFVLKRGAYGVNVAHSGTVAGVLLPPGQERNSRLIQQIAEKFPEIKNYYSLQLTGGGGRYLGKTQKKERSHAKSQAWGKS